MLPPSNTRRHTLRLSLSRILRACSHQSRSPDSSCAIRALRGHGMDDAALKTVFRAVVVSKLQCASCAWWEFSTVADRQRINALIRRSARCGFVLADLPEFEEICRTADETFIYLFIYSTLFRSIISNHNHACTVSLIYFRHNLPHHKTVIFGVDFTTCKYRREFTI